MAVLINIEKEHIRNLYTIIVIYFLASTGGCCYTDSLTAHIYDIIQKPYASSYHSYAITRETQGSLTMIRLWEWSFYLKPKLDIYHYYHMWKLSFPAGVPHLKLIHSGKVSLRCSDNLLTQCDAYPRLETEWQSMNTRLLWWCRPCCMA